MASSTNFVVHKQSTITTLDGHGINTLNALVKSINQLKLKGIPILPMIQLDESGEVKETGGTEVSTIDVEENHVSSGIQQVTTQMVNLIKQMQDLQSKASSPHSQPGQNSVKGDMAVTKSSGETPMMPTSGWTNNHLRDRYLGMAIEYSWTGVRNTWSLDVVIETRDTNSTPMAVTGYMRWRLINAVPHRDNYDKGRMAGSVEKIADGWEADEVFTGKLDVNSGTLQTYTKSLRAVPNNPVKDPGTFIGACVYTFVLCHDGKEMIGRNIYATAESVTKEKFLEATVTRCVAY